MVPGGGLNEEVAKIKEKDFYNHSANAVTKTGPLYLFWKVKLGFSSKELNSLSIDLAEEVLDKMHLLISINQLRQHL